VAGEAASTGVGGEERDRIAAEFDVVLEHFTLLIGELLADPLEPPSTIFASVNLFGLSHLYLLSLLNYYNICADGIAHPIGTLFS
jgi:hypothetical protein